MAAAIVICKWINKKKIQPGDAGCCWLSCTYGGSEALDRMYYGLHLYQIRNKMYFYMLLRSEKSWLISTVILHTCGYIYGSMGYQIRSEKVRVKEFGTFQ